MKRGHTCSRTSSSCSVSVFGFIAYQNAARDDWILCQVTSNPYGDERAIAIMEKDFQSGSLRVTSYARPGKLFTANAGLVVETVGSLKKAAVKKLIEGVVEIFEKGI